MTCGSLDRRCCAGFDAYSPRGAPKPIVIEPLTPTAGNGGRTGMVGGTPCGLPPESRAEPHADGSHHRITSSRRVTGNVKETLTCSLTAPPLTRKRKRPREGGLLARPNHRRLRHVPVWLRRAYQGRDERHMTHQGTVSTSLQEASGSFLRGRWLNN